jgi:Ca2+-binding EF-hand superfamily protein
MDQTRYKEAFVLMNDSKSGLITVDDAHFLIRALGSTPTKDDLEKISANFISSQHIDYLGFVDMMSNLSCTTYSYEQIERAFLTFDKYRHGRTSMPLKRNHTSTYASL